MPSLRTAVSVKLTVVGLVGAGLVGCSSSTEGDPSASGGSGTAGSTSSAGTAPSGGFSSAGGAPAASAGMSSGGSPATGGSGSLSGGGPSGGTGSSGSPAGGTGSGGSSGGTGGALTGGMGTGGSGGTGSGDCVKGQTKGNQVAVIGESFIAASHGITKQIESHAKAAGSLPQNEQYVDESKSGKLLSGNDPEAIPKQYEKAKAGNMIKYVLMDGGGNDCLQANNGDAALAAAQALFQTMATDKVEKVVYFFYPDPLGSFASSGNLKPCLDALRPKMKSLCDGLTAPKCYWMDLRTVWDGHSEYTSDGIHPTHAGDKATGDAIWEVMKTHCVAQ